MFQLDTHHHSNSTQLEIEAVEHMHLDELFQYDLHCYQLNHQQYFTFDKQCDLQINEQRVLQVISILSTLIFLQIRYFVFEINLFVICNVLMQRHAVSISVKVYLFYHKTC